MTTMTDSRAAEVLAAHNEWRRGGDGPQTEPVTLGLALERAIARLREPAGVGGDWVLVPREPTPEMANWFRADEGSATFFTHTTIQCADFESRYSAMLAAAPQPPAEAQPVACDEDRFEQFLQAAIARSPEPLRELGEYLAGVLDDDQWPAADRLLLQLATATPSAPVGVDGVKCPWDGGSPCVEPRPIGMVYPMKPAPRASGYLDGSGVEWNAWDAEQMEAYARAAYSDGWEAGYRSALAQQPAAVDGAMANLRDEILRNDGLTRKNTLAAFRAVEDALAAQPGGSDNDR